MANFITRVELYGDPPKEIYGKLHNAMRINGFSDFFTEGAKKLSFPHAMYCYFAGASQITTKEVVKKAKDIATPFWKDNAILVVRTTDRWEFDNLKPSP